MRWFIYFINTTPQQNTQETFKQSSLVGLTGELEERRVTQVHTFIFYIFKKSTILTTKDFFLKKKKTSILLNFTTSQTKASPFLIMVSPGSAVNGERATAHHYVHSTTSKSGAVSYFRKFWKVLRGRQWSYQPISSSGCCLVSEGHEGRSRWEEKEKNSPSSYQSHVGLLQRSHGKRHSAAISNLEIEGQNFYLFVCLFIPL